VSGLRVVANWRRPEGNRIREVYFKPSSGELRRINPYQTYTVAMVSFIASGFDGYHCFKEEETLVDTEGAMTDTNLVLQIFGYSLPQESPSSDISIDSNGDGLDGKGGNQTPPIHRDQKGREEEDKTEQGIQRARDAIIIGRNDIDDLPIVSPNTDERLRFVDESTL
jgi:hypothetical protein